MRSRPKRKFLAVILTLIVALAVLLVGTVFLLYQVDSWWYSTPESVFHKGEGYNVNIAPASCLPSMRKTSLSDAFVRGQPNGFRVVIGGWKDGQPLPLKVESFSGTITWPDGSENPLYLPFIESDGSDNGPWACTFIAFASAGGYDDRLARGLYRIKVACKVNGQVCSFNGELTLSVRRTRELHIPLMRSS